MPRIKLTEKAIDKLKAPTPGGRQVLYWDTELRGFGVLCSGKSTQRPTSCSATSTVSRAALP